jgi:uncharacterized protein (TIGR02271 family)
LAAGAQAPGAAPAESAGGAADPPAGRPAGQAEPPIGAPESAPQPAAGRSEGDESADHDELGLAELDKDRHGQPRERAGAAAQVTEQVHQTVPAQREEVRLEREPITDANVGDATAGPEISEEEHEITLHEDEVVVEKRAVPKERLRLDKDTVTDEQHVSEEVRKEQIEAEGDTPGRE